MVGLATQSVLSGAVGFAGQNRKTDVQTVQKLLNGVPSNRGGPTVQLDVDGLIGPKTIGAIRQFQLSNQAPSDGRIDPGMTTEKALLALLEFLGLLHKILGGKGGTTPGGPPPKTLPKGTNTPIRAKYLQTARSLVPPVGLTNGTGPKGFSSCGEFPGRVFRHLPVKFPGEPGCFSMTVPQVGKMFLFTPTVGWENFGREVDKKLKPSAPCWRPFGGQRPLPGDIYVLSMFDNPGKFQHVGVIVSAEGSEWTTADGGQGNGHQSGLVKRKFEPNGVITGEFGNKARLKGWVDLDIVYEIANAGFRPL